MDFFRRGQKTSTVDGVPIYSQVDESIRENLKSRLSGSIKDLQIEYGDGNSGVPIETNELTHGLVTAIEAIFIHGLKGQPTRAVSASNLRNLPSPSFWTFVLVFTHKETIGHLEKLNAINTDIGRGRAWVRLALNDSILCSYMTAMVADKNTLRRFYHRHSIFRDADTMDIFIRYLRGIEIYRINIALNSGLLNRWATGPLILAGLCHSENSGVETPPSAAVDAAAMLTRRTASENPMAASSPAADLASEAFEVINKPAGYLNRGLLNEDEALKLILAGVSPVNFSGSSSNTDSPAAMPSSPVMSKRKKDRVVKKSHPTQSVTSAQEENNATDNVPRSQSPEEIMITKIPEEPTSLDSMNTNETTKKEEESFVNGMPFTKDLGERCEGDESSDDEEMIDIYGRRRDSSCGDADSTTTENQGISSEESNVLALAASSDISEPLTKTTSYVSKRGNYGLSSSRSSGSESSLTLASVPYLSGFIDSWQPFSTGRFFDTHPKDDEPLVQCGFSLKPHVQVGSLSENDSQQLMLIFDQVVREEGLDAQNYECAECTRAIGTIFGPAKICSYTRRYYCEECHLDETSTIPAKIMYNWDFRLFRVCHKAKLFLAAVNIEPIIDVKSFNGELFNFATSLKDVLDLRRQLRYMNAYLSTCADGKSMAKTTFAKMLWPRQYLYDDVDVYSVRDLEEIHSGRLVSLLSSAVKFSMGHILKCILCSGKGFICEICRQDQVIFPFELDSIMQCKQCFTVFHLDCSINMTTCPKCDRIEARHLNWQVSLSKSQRIQEPNEDDDATL